MMDENFGFSIDSLLSDEEAIKLFNEDEQPQEEPKDTPDEIDKTDNPAEEPVKEPEKVGEEDNENGQEGAEKPDGDGTSPNVYSSIANALRTDGIFPDFTDDEINAAQTPEDFAELVQKAIDARFDEQTKRIGEALGNGVAPDTIKMYEQTLQYLNSIDEDSVSAEGEEAEALRRQLIYNDLLNRGYSKDKANREVEKSFRSATDIDDAKDALAALKKHYSEDYEKIQSEAKAKAAKAKEEQKQNSEKFKKMILEDKVLIGETELDKKTKQRVYDSVMKPVHKDPETGQLLTSVQKFQKEQPLEFLKQLGLWFVLTDGGKNVEGFTKDQLRKERNKGIRELETKINSSQLNSDGSLRYTNRSSQNEDDLLLSDGWKVGF